MSTSIINTNVILVNAFIQISILFNNIHSPNPLSEHIVLGTVYDKEYPFPHSAGVGTK